MNSIETTQLTRRFGKLEVVPGLTRAVPQGSVFALLGPNGAGKSTTMKRPMNVIELTSGAARVPREVQTDPDPPGHQERRGVAVGLWG